MVTRFVNTDFPTPTHLMCLTLLTEMLVLQRSAIEQWFEGKGAAISPLTMEPLASAQLTPNLAIQQMLSLRASMAEGMHG